MLDSRRLGNGLRRLGLILKRFGLSPKKQLDRIGYYAALLRRHGVRGTFFITGVVLEKHFTKIGRIDTSGVEWGIHGDVHTDFSQLSGQMQESHVRNAVRLFDSQKFFFGGFRAPYLKTNECTLETISRQGRFAYDSSVSIFWDDVFDGAKSSFGFIQSFYRPRRHSAGQSLPWVDRSFVEIPVSLPDDDVLLDREGYGAERVFEVWEKILSACHKNGELFVLQLHPERIYELGDVLENLIMKAKSMDPPIWIATLGEITDWVRRKGPEEKWPKPYTAAFGVTGDIDSITLFDFVDRLIKW